MQKNCGQWVFLTLITILILPGCEKGTWVRNKKVDAIDVKKKITAPTRLAQPNEIPRQFVDDFNFEGMELAIQRQLKRYRQLNNQLEFQRVIRYGQDEYSLSHVKKSLKHFLSLIKEYQVCLTSSSSGSTCKTNLHQQIVTDFKIYVPHLTPGDSRYRETDNTFFTGYYTPLIQVSNQLTADFPHAIYGRPPEGRLRRATRVEIDFDHVLKGSDVELFYAKDLFDLYIMHIQGGGKVQVNKTNTFHYLSFDSTNFRELRFISEYMLDKGYITDQSTRSQHDFLKRNLNKQREIYSSCPSYVFFKVTKTPPLGSDAVPLTGKRSIAMDKTFYKVKGGLAFISSRFPQGPSGDAITISNARSKKLKNYSLFVLDQDIGGAIKGKARVDIYWGEGEYAHFMANNVFNYGRIWFLIKKY